MSAERRLVVWTGTLLLAAALPLTGPALVGPVVASEGCTSEEMPPPAIPPDYGCDDTTPPDTTITEMTPAPNDAGFTRTSSVSFTFTEVVTDGDQGPWAFRCKLDDPATTGAEDETFADCTSPATYSDLADTGSGKLYTFSVYAVDSGDSAIAYPGSPLTTADDEDPAAPDDDSATPATRSWQQDTDPPGASIFPVNRDVSPYDEEGTGWPIAARPQVTYQLIADEDPVDYRCQFDGITVPCHEGENTFTGIKGGDHVLSLGVRDRAGNEDESPATKQFVMPYNLRSAKGWRTRSGTGWFAGDVLQTKRYGATIKFKARNIEQFRLIAPAGPKLGKIQVRLGDWKWKTYDLSKGRRTTSRFIDVRGPNPPLFSGPVKIRNITGGKRVQVDAYVFPPG